MIVTINCVQLLLIVILDALFVQFLAALQFHRYVEGVLQSFDFPLPDEGVVVQVIDDAPSLVVDDLVLLEALFLLLLELLDDSVVFLIWVDVTPDGRLRLRAGLSLDRNEALYLLHVSDDFALKDICNFRGLASGSELFFEVLNLFKLVLF